MLNPQTRLNGRYIIQKTIGQGNMSYVYKAFDDLLKRNVAIKQMIIPHGSEDTRLVVKRFKREFYFLSAIEHENVVKAHGFFAEGNSAFMVLEIISGISLEEMIGKNEISLSMGLIIAIQLARALHVINIAGIIHRDIKPSNMIINEASKKLKLLDLGVAKSVKSDLSRLTNHGHLVGTPDYLSPEQVGGEIAENSDVFSVGVVLYQMFLGSHKSPFHTNSSVSTIMAISTKILPPLIDKVAEKSNLEIKFYQKISDILQKALKKAPEDRTSSARELASQFEAIYKQHRVEKNKRKEIEEEKIKIAERKVTIKQGQEKYQKIDSMKGQKRLNSGSWPVLKNLDIVDLEKFQTLGDKFGRDKISFRKPARKISRRIKKNKPYSGRVKKRKNNYSGLLIFLILLATTLSLIFGTILYFSSTPEKKIIRSRKQNVRIKKLKTFLFEIRLETLPTKWYKLQNFLKTYSSESGTEALKKLEGDIFEKIKNAHVSLEKMNQMQALSNWQNIFQWKDSADFNLLLNENDKINNEFRSFQELFSNKEKSLSIYYTLAINITKDLYFHRKINSAKNGLKNMFGSELDDKKIFFYKEQTRELEKIFRNFKNKMISLKGKKISLFIIKKNQEVPEKMNVIIKSIEKNKIIVKKNAERLIISLYNTTFKDRHRIDYKSIEKYCQTKTKGEKYALALLAFYNGYFKDSYRRLEKLDNYGESIFYLQKLHQKIFSAKNFILINIKKPKQTNLLHFENKTFFSSQEFFKIQGHLKINKKNSNNILSYLDVWMNGKKAKRKNEYFKIETPLEYGKNEIIFTVICNDQILKKIRFFIIRKSNELSIKYSGIGYYNAFFGDIESVDSKKLLTGLLYDPIQYKKYFYVRDAINTFYKFDLKGNLLWENSTVFGSASIYNFENGPEKEFLYLYSSEKLQCFNLKNMAQIWGKKLNFSIDTPGVGSKKYMYFITDKGICAFQHKNGKIVWHTKILNISSLILANKKLFAYDQKGNVHAYNYKNGKKIWSYATNSIISTKLISSGNVVYSGNKKGEFCAIADGVKKWTYYSSSSIIDSTAFANNRVFFANDNNKIYACDAVSGDKIWEYQVKEKIITRLITTENKIYFACQNGYVYALHINTGKKAWQYDIESKISFMFIKKNTMYCSDNNGNLFYLNF